MTNQIMIENIELERIKHILQETCGLEVQELFFSGSNNINLLLKNVDLKKFRQLLLPLTIPPSSSIPKK